MTRVLSALLLIPVVLGVVWFLPPVYTLYLSILASLLAAREYRSLAAALGLRLSSGLMAATVAVACMAVGRGNVPAEVVVLGAMVLIGVSAVLVEEPGPAVLSRAAAAMFAPAYIGFPLGAIAAVRIMGGREAVLLLIATIIVSDSAQYYTGRAFGRTPLAPAISPKKTREGAIGGVVFGTLAMVIGARWVFPAAAPAVVAASALVIVLLGIAGDLFESLLKRSAGVKDSSALIPGHGGILDRIDSWLFAGPAYYLFVRYLQA